MKAYTRQDLAQYYKNPETGTVLQLFQWINGGATESHIESFVKIPEDESKFYNLGGDGE